MSSTSTVWFFLLLRSSAVFVESVTNSEDLNSDAEDLKPSWACNGDEEFRVKALFETEYHWLCLREYNIASSPLMAKNSVFYVNRERKESLRSRNISLVQGYTIGETQPGAAAGYLAWEGQFVGVLHFKDHTVYADTHTDSQLLSVYRRFENDHAPPPSGKTIFRLKRDSDEDVDDENEESPPTDKYVSSSMTPYKPTRTPKAMLPMSATTSKITPSKGSTVDKTRQKSQGKSRSKPEDEERQWLKDATIKKSKESKKHKEENQKKQLNDKHIQEQEDESLQIEYAKRYSESTAAATNFTPIPLIPVYAFSKVKSEAKKNITIPFIARPSIHDSAGRARLCEVLLLADHTFFVYDAKSNLNIAIKKMLHAASLADEIFRNTDFDEDGQPDNIGFTVKYMMVITSSESHMRLFGELPQRSEQDGRDYLKRFAALRKLEEVCLGIAFTGYSFRNSSIGLSYISLGEAEGAQNDGGACDRGPGGLSFNILSVAHGDKGDGQRVPSRLAGLALAHELGHSFGAHHDELFPQIECEHHLMSQHSLLGDKPTHYKFSYCSRQLMRNTIESSGTCLIFDDRTYCGNGIVEGDEACDCGLAANCAARDRCCTPKVGAAAGFVGLRSVHVAGCSVAPNALCHPSQGRCCDKNCSFSDLYTDGIDCSRMHDKCPCAGSQARCSCGLGGECMPDGSCVAAECARLGLKECTCPHHGPGGAVGAAHRCGVCCVLAGASSDVRCASAETAARRLLLAGKVKLEDLKDEDFNGPSVFFKICLARPEVHKQLGDDKGAGCAYVSLRAWYKRGACAALGAIGECAPSGVCVPPVRPAPNMYPITLNQLQRPEDEGSRREESDKANLMTMRRSSAGQLTYKYQCLLCSCIVAIKLLIS